MATTITSRAADTATRSATQLFNHPWHIMGYLMLLSMAWLSYAYARSEDTFARSRTYDLMRDIATEDQWAVAFGIAAALRAVAFVFRHGRFIAFANLVVTFMLTLCAVCFFWSGGLASTGAGLYAVLALMSAAVTARRVFLNAMGRPV